MGRRKMRGSSWLKLAKRVFFRCSTHEEDKKMTSTRRGDCGQQKHRERASSRFVLLKPTNPKVGQCEELNLTAEDASKKTPKNPVMGSKETVTFAVATAAAEAAVTMAQAAVDIVLVTTKPARRTLGALKGLVKLQALVRGHNVRKQAEVTLNCIKAALLQVQHHQRLSVSLDEGSRRRSMFAKTYNLWESMHLQDVGHKSSLTQSRRDGSCIGTVGRTEAALSQGNPYAFSNQVWRAGRHSSFGDQNELHEKMTWFDQWMTTKKCHRRTTINKIEPNKNTEMDAYNIRSSHYQGQLTLQSAAYPIPIPTASNHLPVTPSPFKGSLRQVRSASPRCLSGQKCHSTSHSPRPGATYAFNNSITAANATPNYMAATESAKARVGSQSSSMQRPLMAEGGSVRKRFSYPIPASYLYEDFDNSRGSLSQDLGSPTLKNGSSSYHGHRDFPISNN